jgi:hypothetical protein
MQGRECCNNYYHLYLQFQTVRKVFGLLGNNRALLPQLLERACGPHSSRRYETQKQEVVTEWRDTWPALSNHPEMEHRLQDSQEHW